MKEKKTAGKAAARKKPAFKLDAETVIQAIRGTGRWAAPVFAEEEEQALPPEADPLAPGYSAPLAGGGAPASISDPRLAPISGPEPRSDAVAFRPISSCGLITVICDRLGCSRTTFYRYLELRLAIRQAYEEECERALDMAETALLRLVRSGEFRAVSFYLKCKGRARGYTEKSEAVLTVKEPPKVELVIHASGTAPETE